MKYTYLEDLLLLKLQSLYDIESEIIKALPKMAKSATEPDLKDAFETHLAETEKQKERLEEIFELLGEKPKKMKVEAIRCLVEDAQWIMDQDMSPEALDAALVAAAQYVEHYEMAGYGSAKAWARQLGLDEVADLLDETLTEEEATDASLSALAETLINKEALMPTENE